MQFVKLSSLENLGSFFQLTTGAQLTDYPDCKSEHGNWALLSSVAIGSAMPILF